MDIDDIIIDNEVFVGELNIKTLRQKIYNVLKIGLKYILYILVFKCNSIQEY